jgi:hypothetical protein
MLILVLGAPYLAIVTGRLVPRQQVKDWKDRSFTSEGTRAEAVDAIRAGTKAMDSTRQLVEAILVPLAEQARRDDAS